MCTLLRSPLLTIGRCTRIVPFRQFSDVDFSHEKPAPSQLEHIQSRLIDTTPHFFRTRIDYTFYKRDVVLENQIIGTKVIGRAKLMQHFGFFSVFLKVVCPHIEMEVVDCYPQIEDGTVRMRWRIKYVSWLRAFLNPMLFRFDYRLKNLSWYEGYSIFYADGNGEVYKLTLQRSRQDESYLLKGAENLKKTIEKAVVPKPASTVNAAKTDTKQ